jgi:hypothetical protein
MYSFAKSLLRSEVYGGSGRPGSEDRRVIDMTGVTKGSVSY